MAGPSRAMIRTPSSKSKQVGTSKPFLSVSCQVPLSLLETKICRYEELEVRKRSGPSIVAVLYSYVRCQKQEQCRYWSKRSTTLAAYAFAAAWGLSSPFRSNVMALCGDSFFFSFVAYVGYKDAWFVRPVKIQQSSSIDIIHRRYKFLGE